MMGTVGELMPHEWLDDGRVGQRMLHVAVDMVEAEGQPQLMPTPLAMLQDETDLLVNAC